MLLLAFQERAVSGQPEMRGCLHSAAKEDAAGRSWPTTGPQGTFGSRRAPWLALARKRVNSLVAADSHLYPGLKLLRSRSKTRKRKIRSNSPPQPLKNPGPFLARKNRHSR